MFNIKINTSIIILINVVDIFNQIIRYMGGCINSNIKYRVYIIGFNIRIYHIGFTIRVYYIWFIIVGFKMYMV